MPRPRLGVFQGSRNECWKYPCSMNHFHERRCRFVPLLFLAALIAEHKSPVRAQDNPTEPVKLGSLPGGKLAESLLKMINEGDLAARTKFIETGFTSAALKETPADEY